MAERSRDPSPTESEPGTDTAGTVERSPDRSSQELARTEDRRNRGSLNIEVALGGRAASERERDFARTLHSGGIAVLTPTSFDVLSCRPGKASEGSVGDVSAEAVREAVQDFGEQLVEIGEEVLPDEADQTCLSRALSSGIVLAGLTVAPAVDFLLHAGLEPRIIQPRFVVVLGERSLRVATLGYVGSERERSGLRGMSERTNRVARLLTENLLPLVPGCDTTTVQLRYRVRDTHPTEASIDACISTEVPQLLKLAMDGELISDEHQSGDYGETGIPSPLPIAGVTLPADGIVHRLDAGGQVTLFCVEVAPADGGQPWVVQRRYSEFRDLYTKVAPAANRFAAVSFPRKHARKVTGARLESRRRSLEVWLRELLREAQSRERAWLGPLFEFLEVH
eukprot:TRINITY_DN28552_c0_g1_i1.p1 TRINITY_DN28552_c0_g1~~TRINITY_DN28552_c0_g1_i1.p1  ORF type:complete len:395 (-),score=40.97 TRINITY_DN28552_c0_g1_i1:31-1215(-)